MERVHAKEKQKLIKDKDGYSPLTSPRATTRLTRSVTKANQTVRVEGIEREAQAKVQETAETVAKKQVILGLLDQYRAGSLDKEGLKKRVEELEREWAKENESEGDIDGQGEGDKNRNGGARLGEIQPRPPMMQVPQPMNRKGHEADVDLREVHGKVCNTYPWIIPMLTKCSVV
jgi:hypothetical protein